MSATNSFDAVYTTALTQVDAQSSDEGWILIGTVDLKNSNGNTICSGQLYIREVAQSLIYRVKYNEGNYSASPTNKTLKGDDNEYYVTIGGLTLYFKVPAMPNGGTSDRKTGLDRFVGTWKTTGTNYGDIQISQKDEDILVQMKTAWGLKSSRASLRGDELVWSFEAETSYGKWKLQYTPHGYILVGEGWRYADDEKVTDFYYPSGELWTSANREVLKCVFTGSLDSNGNLEINQENKYYYYDYVYGRDQLVFKRDGPFKSKAIYTQW